MRSVIRLGWILVELGISWWICVSFFWIWRADRSFAREKKTVWRIWKKALIRLTSGRKRDIIKPKSAVYGVRFSRNPRHIIGSGCSSAIGKVCVFGKSEASGRRTHLREAGSRFPRCGTGGFFFLPIFLIFSKKTKKIEFFFVKSRKNSCPKRKNVIYYISKLSDGLMVKRLRRRPLTA